MNAIISVREFNANISATLARVEAGESLNISKNGKVIAEIRPPRPAWQDDPEKCAKVERGREAMRKGIPGIAPATYEERTSRQS